MDEITAQAIGYGVVLFLAFGIMSVLFRGFFWKYIRVRASMGRLVLVKLRNLSRDHFKIGKVEEGFLIYKNKEEKRIAVKDFSFFYRCMGVSWVDVDEETSSVCAPDYKAVTGFDSERFQSLYTRCLMRPEGLNTKEIIIIILVLLAIVTAGISVYLGYTNLQELAIIKKAVITSAPPITPTITAGL